MAARIRKTSLEIPRYDAVKEKIYVLQLPLASYGYSIAALFL
jgi:hypothetical protein